MDVKQQFLKLLRKVKIELMFEHGAKQFQQLLLFASVFTMAIFIISRFIVIVNIILYLIVGLIALLAIFMYKSWQSSPNIRQAALLYDRYAGEDRTSTALSFINEQAPIYDLQREDALLFMKKSEVELRKRKRKFIYPLPISIACILFVTTSLLIIFPSEKMTEAKERKTEIKVVKEVKKELEEKTKEEKNETVKKAIEAALKEMENKQKMDDALKALIKQNNELDLQKIQSEKQKLLLDQSIDQLKSMNMDKLAQALEDSNKADLKKEMEKLKENFSELTEEEKNALADILGEGEEMTEEQFAALEAKLQDMLNSVSEANSLASAQSLLQESAMNLQQAMKDSGIKSSVDLAEALANGQKQSGQGTQQTGNQSGEGGKSPSENPGDQSGNVSGQGQSPSGAPGNGAGSGQGAGSQPGSGSGSGSGTGTGSGGTGTGPGAGTGMGSRELTIPETVDGKINTENDLGELGKGDPAEQGEGYGPILKGSVRPYEQVYNQYEKASRESVERMQLPAELENIVKDYFTTIKPK